MDTETDTQGGIQMILGAAEMLEQRGDESLAQRRFSEGDTESEGEEELAGDVGEPCFDSSDGEEHTSEHQPLGEQSSVGWWRETQPWPPRQRSSRGDREPTDHKREKAVALHNKKEQIRRKELREAIHRLRNQLKRRTKKPSTISVLKAAQHEIRELKCQEAEGQQELDALNKKKNYLTWRLEKLVSEYNENRLRPPQVQPAIPGSFLHSNSSSRQPGDSHMMMPQLPNHPATSTGGTIPPVAAAFPPHYLPVPTPSMLPTAPFHFHNSTIPSPPIIGFPPQFFLPSPTLQPPFMMPGSYFCAPGRFGHPSSRLLPTNSMFGLPPAPMLCPQLPMLQQHQNMVDSRSQDGYHSRKTQKDQEYTPEHYSQIRSSPRTRHCLSNSSRHCPVINHTAGSTDISSTYSDSNSCTSEEDCATREEEEIVDVEQDGPEVDGTRLPIQATPHHHLNSSQVEQRNHHSLETQRAIRSEPDLVQRLSSDDNEEPRLQKNLPDIAASRRTRTDTSLTSPCGNKHSKLPKKRPKNLQDPPQLMRRVNKKKSISRLPNNIHVPSNLPKNLPGPPLLKRSQAETDNAVLVSRVVENIRPQREHISKKVSESALEKFSKFDLNLCNDELGHQLGPQQRTYNTDCDPLCKEKPNKKNGQIVRVSTEQGQQVACSVF